MIARSVICCALLGVALATVQCGNQTSEGPWHFQITRPQKTKPISPLIYGAADTPENILRMNRIPLNRWGGNPSDRYNWKLGNAWNVGNDWFFRNFKVRDDAWRDFLNKARRTRGMAVLTVPLVGYVAKDTSSYSFSIKKYGWQVKHDPHHPDAGNGELPGERFIFSNDPLDANVPADSAFVGEWLDVIKKEYSDLITNGQLMIAMGNEPMLWNKTHRDVHPVPVTYDAYLSVYKKMAGLVRQKMPTVPICGPDLWGWPALFDSARDRDGGGGKDRKNHGGTAFLPWFLKEMKAHEDKTGDCLLDVVTIHYYPQAWKVYGEASDEQTRERRLKTTRSLWDPSFKDPSWINDTVMLIPRVKAWIKAFYPNRKLGLMEYNWGAEHDISGALAQAELLGIFGREGLDMACYWLHPPLDSFTAEAFAIYRNVDGKGTGFGSESLNVNWTSKGNPPSDSCSIFAAETPSKKLLTVITINKSPKQESVVIDLPDNGWALVDRYILSNTTKKVAVNTREDAHLNGTALTLKMEPHSAYHIRLEK